MGRIVEIQFGPAAKTARGSQRSCSRLDTSARDWLAEKGWDPAYGARPLKRVIQRYVQDPLAEMILGGDVRDGDRVAISVKGNVLTFNGKARRPPRLLSSRRPIPKRKLKLRRRIKSPPRSAGEGFLLRVGAELTCWP